VKVGLKPVFTVEKHLIFGSQACRLTLVDQDHMITVGEQTILEKLWNLPLERLATAIFTRIWDNHADAEYDRLGVRGSSSSPLS
jgi:hypothetical protein